MLHFVIINTLYNKHSIKNRCYTFSFIINTLYRKHSQAKILPTLRYFPIHYISYKTTYFQNILMKSFPISFSYFFTCIRRINKFISIISDIFFKLLFTSIYELITKWKFSMSLFSMII